MHLELGATADLVGQAFVPVGLLTPPMGDSDVAQAPSPVAFLSQAEGGWATFSTAPVSLFNLTSKLLPSLGQGVHIDRALVLIADLE